MSDAVSSRRTLLRAAGAAGAALGVGLGSAGVSAQETRVCTYACGEGKETNCHVDVCDWAPSALTAHNCSECTTHLAFASSEKASTTRAMDEHEYEEAGNNVRLELAPSDRVTIFFTGHVRRLELGDGDVNVAITQRTDADPCPERHA